MRTRNFLDQTVGAQQCEFAADRRGWAAALELLKDRERGSRIVVVLTDTGLKYLSTPLFDV